MPLNVKTYALKLFLTTSQILYAQLCLKSYTGHNCLVPNVCGLLYFSHTIVKLSVEIKSSSDKSLLSDKNVPKGFELSMCFTKILTQYN